MLRFTLMVIVSLLVACGSKDAARRPDVVLIVLDTTRMDHLGPFTADDPTPTPFLDRLAEQCIVFENAWTAATITAPSTASIITGLLPPRHGVEDNLRAAAPPRSGETSSSKSYEKVDLLAIPHTVKTLAEHLTGAGYQTIGISANVTICEELGFARGFDEFSVALKMDAEELIVALRERRAELDPDRPSFFYLHFMDPHAPYTQRQPWCPHSDLKGCGVRCRYASEISYLDSQLERLFAEMGWPDDTLMIIVTDHGEEFRDHGGLMHRFTVYQELSRAGMMLHGPGGSGLRSTLPVHHIDVLPTILEFLDLPQPAELDGVSLASLLAAEPSSTIPADRPLLTSRHLVGNGAQLWGLTVGHWRLLESLPSGDVELYNLESDPRERRDRSKKSPQELKRMQALLNSFRDDLDPIEHEHVSVDLTGMVERLIELGYGGEEEQD